MKLHYFSGSTLPSSNANAVHVMKMCKAFAQACGHEITLFAKSGGGCDRAVYEHYDVDPVFTLIRSPRIRAPGFSGALRIVWTLLRQGRADLIYGRDLWTLAAMTFTNRSIALELHEIPKSRFQRAALRRILRARNLRGLIVITQGLREDLLAFAPYFEGGKILIASDGADCPAGDIVPAALDPVPGTDFQAGYAGSLYPGKGAELILQIAAAAPQTGFHIFGGPLAELENWKMQDTPRNVKFYGPVPHRDVAAKLAACDVLLAPYLPSIRIDTGADIARWISPLKLFEYMATGRPILCSDLPVLREVMENGRNALLLDPLRPEDWARALEQLKRDPGLCKALADQAFTDLESRYSWRRRAQKISSFLFTS